jgi:hypothetical protein
MNADWHHAQSLLSYGTNVPFADDIRKQLKTARV